MWNISLDYGDTTLHAVANLNNASYYCTCLLKHAI